jgi:hypothetical protein
MATLDSRQLAPSFVIPSDAAASGSAHRLIVLMPDLEAEPANIAQHIWELASSLGSGIQLLGLCQDEAQESSLRRQMISLAATVKAANISVESKIEFGRNWLDAVKHNWQPGDAIVCFEGQTSGLDRSPLEEILAANFSATIHVLDGFHSDNQPRLYWISTILAWAGSLGILAGFFWLQVKLVQMHGDWAHTSLLYLSIFIEVGLILGWNSLFS